MKNKYFFLLVFKLILVFLLMPPDGRAVESSGKKYQIISLQTEFKTFWESAKGKSSAEQLKLWDSLIEKPHKSFFDFAVWEIKTRPNWENYKSSMLQSRFAVYPKIYDSIEKAFIDFPQIVEVQLNRFKKVFPKFYLDFPIYAVLAPNFDAKGVLTSEDKRSIALALALDSIVMEKANYDIMFPHELFHVYHAHQSGFLNDGVMPDTTIAVPLWEEGLATYVSSLINPQSKDSDLLFEPEFRKINNSDIRWMANKFLEQIDTLTLQKSPSENFKMWFSNGSHKLRFDLPDRCGYLLGLYVVRILSKKYSLEVMIRWRPDEIPGYVSAALNELKNN